MTIFEELERQKIADALEVIIDVCKEKGEYCNGCPLILNSYCVLCGDIEEMKEVIAKLRSK